jgi:hypothetical protein
MMSESVHLTEQELDRFRRNDAGAAEIFAWADHLGACADCTRAATVDQRIGDMVRTIDAEGSAHLDFEPLNALLDGSIQPIDREIAESHLEGCATCRDELADLRLFAREERLRQPHRWNRWWLAAAAALALLVTGAILTVRREAPHPVAPVRVATLAIPPLAVELHAYTRELRGRARDASALEPLSPIGRIVVEDRPLFEWTAIGRSRYVVEIFDEQYRPVATSPRLTATRWVPAHPLPADRILTWQVTAFDRAGSITAPRPPSSEARFFILERDRARVIRSLEQQERPSISLGIAYAESGALAEAQQELSALIAANREVETARQLLQQVQRASP